MMTTCCSAFLFTPSPIPLVATLSTVNYIFVDAHAHIYLDLLYNWRSEWLVLISFLCSVALSSIS